MLGEGIQIQSSCPEAAPGSQGGGRGVLEGPKPRDTQEAALCDGLGTGSSESFFPTNGRPDVKWQHLLRANPWPAK